jgi:hypothetical protein
MKKAIYSILIPGVLISSMFWSCSKSSPQSEVIARVGSEVIGLDDFKRAYIPVLLYSDKRESPETREEILNYLIDQAILSQTARALDLDTIPTLDVLRRTAEKAAFTRLLYRDEVRSKLQPVSDAALREAFRRSHTKRLVSHLFTKDSSTAAEMFGELERGASWDSLATEYFKDPSLATSGGMLGWMSFGEMDPQFENAAFETPEGEISPPMRTRFGWHIIQVHDESRELMLTEYDYQLERSSLEQTIRGQREQARADSVITDMMNRANLEFDPVIAPQVWDLVHTQIHRLLDEASLQEISPQEMRSFADVLEPLLDQEMLTFSGQSWKVRDFVTHLPEMNRQLMLSDLKKATGFLVRDEIIYQKGLAQGLNDRPEVKAEIRDRENQFLANLYLRYRASSHKLSEKSIATYYSQNASSRYLAQDSLYIQQLELLDPEQLSQFLEVTKNVSDLDQLKDDFALGISNLGWFQGATGKHADYYHRLVNLPVKTLVGPLQNSNGTIFIRVLTRKRNIKPLEQVRAQVEQDAFDHWLQRLKLEELDRLRGNFEISIDRDRLLNFHI